MSDVRICDDGRMVLCDDGRYEPCEAPPPCDGGLRIPQAEFSLQTHTYPGCHLGTGGHEGFDRLEVLPFQMAKPGNFGDFFWINYSDVEFIGRGSEPPHGGGISLPSPNSGVQSDEFQ